MAVGVERPVGSRILPATHLSTDEGGPMFAKRTVLSLLAAAAIASVATDAQSADRLALRVETEQVRAQDGRMVEAPARHRKALAGSWLMTVTMAGGPTFKSLVTFAQDGSLLSYDQGSVLLSDSFSRVFSAGHGVWEHQARRNFSTTTVQLISGVQGAGVADLIALLTTRATLTLDASHDRLFGVLSAVFTDPAGNLLNSFDGTIEGDRIKSEPLP